MKFWIHPLNISTPCNMPTQCNISIQRKMAMQCNKQTSSSSNENTTNDITASTNSNSIGVSNDNSTDSTIGQLLDASMDSVSIDAISVPKSQSASHVNVNSTTKKTKINALVLFHQLLHLSAIKNGTPQIQSLCRLQIQQHWII